jgi:hypothetical protein
MSTIEDSHNFLLLFSMYDFKDANYQTHHSKKFDLALLVILKLNHVFGYGY